MRLACLFAVSALLAASDRTPLGQGPTLFVQRATTTTGAKLILATPSGQEQVLQEDPRLAQDPGVIDATYRNPYVAFSMSPGGDQVLFGSFGKASFFSKTKHATLFMPILGATPLAEALPGFKTKKFEGFYAWSKTTGKTVKLWGPEELETLWESQAKALTDPTLKGVKILEALGSGLPMQCFHLEGSRFLWSAGAVNLEIDTERKTLRPIAAGRGNCTVWAWETREGTIRIQYPDFLVEVQKDGSQKELVRYRDYKGWANLQVHPDLIVQWPEEEKYPVTMLVKGKDTVMIQDQKGGDGASAFATTDGQWVLVSRKNEVKAFGRDGKLRWSTRTSMKQAAYLVQEGGLLGLLGLTQGSFSTKATVAKVELATGKLIEEREIQAELTAQGPRATPALLDRGCLIPTPEGSVLWLPSRAPGGEPEDRAWHIPGSKDLSPREGLLALLGTDFILRPIFARPMADQLVVSMGNQSLPLPTWSNAGIHYPTKDPAFPAVKGESELSFYQELHVKVGAPQSASGVGLQPFPSELLSDWALGLLRTHRSAPPAAAAAPIP